MQGQVNPRAGRNRRVNALAAQAVFDGPQQQVHVRVAGTDDAVFVDLADPSWRAVKITAEGWSVVTDPPVRFRRPAGMLALPEPVSGGEVALLREVINVDETGWRLLAGVVVGMLSPTGPFPLFVLAGPQGSAKSTTARLVRSLVDPNSAPLRAEPRDERDLAIAARNAWVIAWDNLSRLSAQTSDALCRLCTGGGFATRQLWTDTDEVLFDAQRPVIVTSIGDVVTRPDLLDRAVLLTLSPIDAAARRTEAEVWARFEQLRPHPGGGV